MAVRASRNFLREVLYRKVKSGVLGASRHSSSVSGTAPKIPQSSKKWRCHIYANKLSNCFQRLALAFLVDSHCHIYIGILNLQSVKYEAVEALWETWDRLRLLGKTREAGRLLTGATIGLVIAGGAYASTVDEATFCGWLFSATKLVNPFFAFLDAEVAHRLAVSAAARGWVPREKRPDPSILGLEVWGRKFSNPIGLSAGFDKNAEAVEGLLGLGFGFVEVGSVTPVPQEGNPKPRIFRLPQEGAIINRCGFNSEGIVAVAKRLGAQHGKRKLDETSSTSSSSNDEVKPGGKAGPGILGVNLGKNKTSEDAVADYVQGVHTLSQYADYLVDVINISSPNTPGLRKLQGRKQLKDLVKKLVLLIDLFLIKVQAARDEMQWGEEGPPPLLVKIAPDLSKQDLEDIAAVALTLRLDGLGFMAATPMRGRSPPRPPDSQGEPALFYSNEELNSSATIFQHVLIAKFTFGRSSIEVLADFIWETIHMKLGISVGSEPSVVPIWINLPGLPINFFNPKDLKAIGSIVGKVLKVDGPTKMLSRSSMARICVEIDVSKSKIDRFCETCRSVERRYFNRKTQEKIKKGKPGEQSDSVNKNNTKIWVEKAFGKNNKKTSEDQRNPTIVSEEDQSGVCDSGIKTDSFIHGVKVCDSSLKEDSRNAKDNRQK
ncbi:hypothetical protein HHK36_014545 [Tetracentron sinense]|uniref:Dihydroorotate dehydrogenase (quinone), mitochondrial n=1 Tax=Tetracentron sinense TaxID=13715 RepID=A0A834Z1I7_TETSI|nr:hypothetical protein HHK36_014545 [Tetracentron sinense]